MEHAAASGILSVASAIERSALGLAIRDAVYVYPAANVLHVLAVIVFFATVAVMDLRVLGALRGEATEAVIRRFRGFAFGVFGVLAVTGAVLLIPEASALLRNPAFLIKLVLIAIALANLIWFERLLGRGYPGMTARAARWPAAVSLILWLGVAAAGRAIAYV